MFPHFSAAELQRLYVENVQKDHLYLSKYDTLDPMTILFLESIFTTPEYAWDVRSYTRVRTILDCREWIEKYQITSDTIAYTCEEDPELRLLAFKNKILIDYNHETGVGDLHALTVIEKFNFFLFHQTLEHLYNPFLAVSNIFRSLKNGGYVFTSVPTINIPHMTPLHFNGFTPMGLCMLFVSCGFRVLEIGQWGNYEYIQKLFSTHSWPGYRHLSDYGITNEAHNVVDCWILAVKDDTLD